MAEDQSGEFEPVYLTLADILELHAVIVGVTATAAGFGPCDRVLQASAVA